MPKVNTTTTQLWNSCVLSVSSPCPHAQTEPRIEDQRRAAWRAGGLWACGHCGHCGHCGLLQVFEAGLRIDIPPRRQNAASLQPMFQMDAKPTTGCETADRASRGGVDREWAPPVRELGSNTVFDSVGPMVPYFYTIK